MKLNITEFYNNQRSIRNYQSSIFKLGLGLGLGLSNNVAAYTCNHNYNHNYNSELSDYLILDNNDKLAAFRAFISLRGWNQQEIAELTSNELNSLCIQWIASDIRESILGSNPDAWLTYEEDSIKGSESGRLFKNNDIVYFDIGYIIYFDLRESI